MSILDVWVFRANNAILKQKISNPQTKFVVYSPSFGPRVNVKRGKIKDKGAVIFR